MKTFGILALGGAMGVQFEDLSYNNLREAFMEVSQNLLLRRIFDPFLVHFKPLLDPLLSYF